MKFVRKSLAVAALAFGAAFLLPAAAQASPSYPDEPTYDCSILTRQASANNFGLLNGNNVAVTVVKKDYTVGNGLGLLGIANPIGSVQGC